MTQLKDDEIEKLTGPMDSALGRFFVFCLTIGLLFGSCLGIIYSFTRESTEQGLAPLWFTCTVILMFMTYTVAPLFAEWAGIDPKSRWKPYYFIYHLAFYLIPFAWVFLGLGYGNQSSYGTFYQRKVIENVTDILPGDSFGTLDGFVATNLTRAFIETLTVDPLGNLTHTVETVINETDKYAEVTQQLKINQAVKYREVKYFEPENPQVHGFKLPLPPDTKKHIIVAPIFRGYSKCLARFRATTTCMTQNSILGWAISTRKSWCNSLGLVQCKEEHLEVVPMYGCLTTDGNGLCGRVKSALDQVLVDIIVDTHANEGWFFEAGSPREAKVTYNHTLNKAPMLWVDVNADPCILDRASCEASWSSYGFLGTIITIFAISLIGCTALLDGYADARLRVVRSYVVNL